MQIIKKDGTLEQYDEQKIINACNKAARRAMVELSDSDYQIICNAIFFSDFSECTEQCTECIF